MVDITVRLPLLRSSGRSLAMSQTLEATVKPYQSSQGGNDVTDLTRFPSATFKIENMGQGTCNINIGAFNQATTQTFSPKLADSVLTNYRTFANIHSTSVSATIMNLALLSVTQIVIRVGRVPTGALANSTGITITPASLASVTDQSPPIAHGADADILPHSHGTTVHTVNDPTHIHSVDTSSALSITVDWMIVHI